MARRCVCGRLLAAVNEDPRLRTLPLAARMMFLLVAEAAARSAVPGVLPFSGTARVSLLVSASETETETHLETLRAEGLLADAEGGGIAVPLLVEAASRAVVARRNGAGGGRPRKGETPEQAYQRRQGAMLLAVQGGAGKPSETQAAKPVSASTTTTSDSVSSSEAVAPAWVSLGAELVEVARLDQARGGFDYRAVKGWMDQGIGAETIRAAVRRAAGRPGYDPRRVRVLGYFAKAVDEEAARAAPAAAVAVHRGDTPEEAERMAAWQRRIDAVVMGLAAA
jgi:hypothetical protein